MKNRKYWFLNLTLVLPAVVLLVILSSLQLASADVDGESCPLMVHKVGNDGLCFSLTPTTSIAATPFAMHVFTLALTNESCGAGETFVLTHTDSMWGDNGDSFWVDLSLYDVTLGEGASEDVVVTMTVRPDATSQTTGTTVVTATAGGDVVTSTLQLWTGGEDGKGCRCDINFNGGIDAQDIQRVAGAWPLAKGNSGFVPFYDYNLNDMIDILDIARVAGRWPTVCPASSGTTAPQPQLPYTVTASISPTLVYAAPDETIILEIFVEDIPITETLGAFEFTLEYDDAVISVDVWGNTGINRYHPTLNPDGWLGKAPDERNWEPVGAWNQNSNLVQMGGFSLSGPSGLPGPYGDGIAAFYEFHAGGYYGVSDVDFAGFNFVGAPSGDAYHVVFNPGQVIVTHTQVVTPSYSLTVYTVGKGTVIKTPDQVTYTSGAKVELTAQPDSGWEFDHWSGGLTNSDNPATITMDNNKVVTATFVQVYTVTASISPTVVYVAPGEMISLEIFVEDIPITGTLGYFQFTLEYDDTVLAAKTDWGSNTGINMDWLMSPPNERNWFQTGPVEPDSNLVQMAGYSMSDPPGLPGPYGDGAVAFYGFEVLPDASCFGPSSITIGVGADDVVGDPHGSAYHVIYNAGGVVGCGTCNLTVNIAPEAAEAAGCSVVQDPAPPYVYSDVVELDPSAAPCWVFDHWSGDLTGSDDPATVTVDANKVITAHFTAPTHTLAVNTVGSGSVIKNPDETAYICGEVVTLTAYADANARFAEWSGDLTGSANPITITMDSNKAITATFVETFTLVYSGCGCGTVQVEEEWPDGYYDYGETITITAIQECCYEFDGWIGDLASYGTQNPIVITITESLSFSVSFSMITYTSITVNTVGSGSAVVDPATGPYLCGDTITGTATADMYWSFDHWSGAATGNDNPISFVLDEESGTILNAHFTQYTSFLPVMLKKAPG